MTKRIIWMILGGVFALGAATWAVNYAEWGGPTTAGDGGLVNSTYSVTGGGRLTGFSYGKSSRVGANLLVDGILTAEDFAQTATGNFMLTSANVSVTTPTVAFAVPTAGANYLVLNTDTNQTGCYLTGTGVAAGTIIRLTAGAGSNTIRFDDNGTTLALGGNITLTEGQDDFLTLICTTVQGSNSRPCFARVSSSDN